MIHAQQLMDVERTIEYRGKFTVQLAIPKGSTLIQSEIEKILAISSWQVDPNTQIGRYEGGRGVVFQREHQIEKQGLPLGALYLSGIGYRPMIIGEDMMWYIEKNAPIHPPNKTNFMDCVKYNGGMATGYFEDGKAHESRPDFRATGTYTADELATKVANTLTVSKLPLSFAVVPHIEAYGRFLDDELSDENGNYGFIVFPVPEVSITRADDLIINHINQKLSSNIKFTLEDILHPLEPIIRSVARGLYDIHQNGVVHLQPHLGNAYVIGVREQNQNVPYIMDWHTMRRLGSNPFDNVKNIELDISILALSLTPVIFNVFRNSTPSLTSEEKDTISTILKNVALDHYN